MTLKQCKKLPLTQGKFALVDSNDYEAAKRFKWYAQHDQRYDLWYVMRHISPKRTQTLHRFIAKPKRQEYVDHINGDGLDNRRSNLRVCTNSQNQQNQRLVRGASKYKGIHRHGQGWAAQIQSGGTRFYLGTFGTEAEAARAYDEAALLHNGCFARTNKMIGLLC